MGPLGTALLAGCTVLAALTGRRFTIADRAYKRSKHTGQHPNAQLREAARYESVTFGIALATPVSFFVVTVLLYLLPPN